MEVLRACAALQDGGLEVGAALGFWAESPWRGMMEERVSFFPPFFRLRWVGPWSAVELGPGLWWRREETWEAWSGRALIGWQGRGL